MCYPCSFNDRSPLTDNGSSLSFSLESSACGLGWSNGSSMEKILPSFQQCRHIITTYVVADLLHFAAFAIGLYGERVLRIEQLYALMEKVVAASPLELFGP